MTSQFDQDEIQQRVASRLDEANQGLSQSVRQDIAMARRRALLQAQNADSTAAKKSVFGWSNVRSWQVAAPMAFAVALVFLVSYQPSSQIPAFPAELVYAELPPEDLNLLEDLEFATWLATQELPSEKEVVL